MRKVVTGEPALLMYRGEFSSIAMLRARVTCGEVRAAVRAAGIADLDDVEAVVLETDGTFSVVARNENIESSSLEGVYGARPSASKLGSNY